jgi:hypothetical protein
VLGTRYPYSDAGKLAATEFALAGALAGAITGIRSEGGAAVVTYAVLFGAISAIISLIVYASQGPQRPASVPQASSADGVVSGLLIGFFCAMIVAIAASGHTRTPSTVQVIVAFVLSAVSGGIIGGLLGLLLFLVVGRERLTRAPVPRRERRKQAAVSGKKRRR